MAKSTASREKLNIYKANSTPNRAFFVREFRTPKENALGVVLSMVGRKGQPLAVGCSPCMAVSHPFTLYRQTVRSLAESLISIYKDTAKMIYKFLCLNRTQPTYNQQAIYIEADSEENARFQLSADYRLLLDRPIAKFAKNPTAYHNQATAQGGVYA
ncbi:host cell division inhibitor Icd-like protein [Ursidibacter arcticus]